MPKTIFSGANQIVVDALKQSRLDAASTQKQVAERLDRDQSWISLIEGSQRRVDVVEFIELAKALDADPVTLFAQIAKDVYRARDG